MLAKLNSYVEQGLLKRQVSPCGHLVLFDYTEKCQFEKAWDDITLNHRGTVYNLETGELVARAFPKFFNFSELSPERQKSLLYSKQFSVYEKVDGSLGIIYYFNGEWKVNTRGSFTSDQAAKGLEMLNKLDTWKLNINYTYLAEIVYPENRIVVDYKGEEFLALLEILDTKTGENRYTSKNEVFKIQSRAFPFQNIGEVLDKLRTLPFNEEGYVVQFEDGSRAKFKGDEYVEMHRLISGLSPLTIWERMENGIVSKEFLATIPEEFRTPYEEIAAKLEENYRELSDNVEKRCVEVHSKALKTWNGDISPENRKDIGLYLKTNEHELNQFVFPFYLKKEGLYDMIKKHIRPTGNKL